MFDVGKTLKEENIKWLMKLANFFSCITKQNIELQMLPPLVKDPKRERVMVDYGKEEWEG